MYVKVTAPGNGSVFDLNVPPYVLVIRHIEIHAGIKRQAETNACHGLPLKHARTSG